jgi:DNA-binding transcriptional LysR family regulator
MVAISARNLTSVDLNLLLVLHVVLRERSVTAAAKRLAVSQSAVSNSLARLRDIFGDLLVVRSGNRLVATPVAQELAPRLAAAVEHLERVVQREHAFDPSRSVRSFTLACSDWTQVCDVPIVFEAFRRRMPRAVLRVISTDAMLGADGLAGDHIDVALGPPEAGEGLHYEALYTQGGVLVVRKDNNRIGDTITPEEFDRLPYVDTVMVPAQPGANQIAAELSARRGFARNVVLAVSHFNAAAMAVARTDCVAGLPERLAGGFCRVLPLRPVRTAVMDKLKFETGMIWHERTDLDPGSRFFRDVIREALIQPSRMARPRGRRAPAHPGQ